MVIVLNSGKLSSLSRGFFSEDSSPISGSLDIIKNYKILEYKQKTYIYTQIDKIFTENSFNYEKNV